VPQSSASDGVWFIMTTVAHRIWLYIVKDELGGAVGVIEIACECLAFHPMQTLITLRPLFARDLTKKSG
jgi:hypothetical protein